LIIKEVKRNLEVRNGNYKLRIANYKEVEFKNCELVAACSLKDKKLTALRRIKQLVFSLAARFLRRSGTLMM
jgi:hypothetical protein